MPTLEHVRLLAHEHQPPFDSSQNHTQTVVRKPALHPTRVARKSYVPVRVTLNPGRNSQQWPGLRTLTLWPPSAAGCTSPEARKAAHTAPLGREQRVVTACQVALDFLFHVKGCEVGAGMPGCLEPRPRPREHPVGRAWLLWRRCEGA